MRALFEPSNVVPLFDQFAFASLLVQLYFLESSHITSHKQSVVARTKRQSRLHVRLEVINFVVCVTVFCVKVRKHVTHKIQ